MASEKKAIIEMGTMLSQDMDFSSASDDSQTRHVAHVQLTQVALNCKQTADIFICEKPAFNLPKKSCDFSENKQQSIFEQCT